MKKLLAIFLALSLLALCACASKTASSAEASTTQSASDASQTQADAEQTPSDAETGADAAAEEDAAADEAEADDRVKPLPDTLDVSNLTDATVAASFDESAIEESDGKTYLTLQVYDYDRYDMADIANLAAGDVIVAGGKDMTVESVETDGGFVTINGGLEKGGMTLTTNDDGVYYEIGMDDALCYQEKGEIRLELADSFTLTDNSDLDHPNQSYTASQLPELMAGGFTANNTLVTIEGGKITSITRSYTP